HCISPGQRLDYQIRFQNTGTAIAHNVVVLDTLPPSLNPITIHWWASSHHYTYQILSGNFIKWTFFNILLIYSFTSEPLSHGIVDFNIQQYPHLPLGTINENSAAIYFDMNAPVITQKAQHQLCEDFMGLSATQSLQNNADIPIIIKAYPNPFHSSITLQ